MASPTPFQSIEVPLAGQLDDKTARLARGPSVMRSTLNIDHRFRGELRKRRGYTRLSTAGSVLGQTPGTLFLALGDNGGELVLIGRDNILSIAANDDVIDGESLVFRGPSMSGNYKLGTVHVSPVSTS